MKMLLLTALCRSLFISVLFFPVPSWALYNFQISQATQWLSLQQNADGSWGTTAAEQFILTVESTQALHSAGLRNTIYYRGLTWLENHAALNVDYATRRAGALNNHGDQVLSVIEGLDSAQNTSFSERKGWGVSEHYLQSPLDTAIVLTSLDVIGTTLGDASINAQSALNYLKSIQLNTAGWPISLASTTDPFTTAWVIKALVAWKHQDNTLVAVINNAINALSNVVNNNSPHYLQALSAQSALLSGHTSIAQPWLISLDANQETNGSWSNRVYDTALTIRAFSAADGLDSSSNQTSVRIPDANLRTAINTALGRNSLDALDRIELAKLTTLKADGMNIKDLTGLEWAINLTALDIRNNDIASTTPIDNLTQLTTLRVEDYENIPQLNKKEKLLFSMNETAVSILASMANATSCSDIQGSYQFRSIAYSNGTGFAELADRLIDSEIIQDDVFKTLVNVTATGVDSVGNSSIQDLDMTYHFSGLGETLDAQGTVQINVNNAGSNFETYDIFIVTDYYWGPVYNSRVSNGVLDDSLTFVTRQSGPRTKWRKTSQYRRQDDINDVNSLTSVTSVQIAPDNAPLCKISLRKADISDYGSTMELNKTIKVQAFSIF